MGDSKKRISAHTTGIKGGKEDDTQAEAQFL